MSRVKWFSLALGLAVVIHLAQVFLSMPGGVQSAPPTSGIQYVDVTKASGLTFRHNSGASGKKYLPETLGPGVAFIDYNGDGWQDLFFTNGKDWPGQRQDSRRWNSFATTRTARSPMSLPLPASIEKSTEWVRLSVISTTTGTRTVRDDPRAEPVVPKQQRCFPGRHKGIRLVRA